MDTQVLSIQNERSLTILQLATSFRDSFNYISGNKAINDNVIQVTEINESGSVNDLTVINLSNKFVFFMDGDILAGAKQNRVLNTSVLLSPNSKTRLPVSCVEQGRWRHTSSKFRSTDFSAPTAMRARKARDVKESLKEERGHYSDQGAVWESVTHFSMLHEIQSDTSNLSDIFDSKMNDFEELSKHFIPDPNANGLAVFVNNRLLNIDIFNRTDIYHEYFAKIIKGVAIEAIRLTPKAVPTEAEVKYKTVDFLDKFETLNFEMSKGVGIGNEKRFETTELTGFELVYKDETIHLTALNIKDDSEKKSRRRSE
jgi:hypothetical protein